MCDGLCLNDVRAVTKMKIEPLHCDINFVGTHVGGVSRSTCSRKSILNDRSKNLAKQYIESMNKKDIIIDEKTGCICHNSLQGYPPTKSWYENKKQIIGPRMHVIACFIKNDLPVDFFQKDYDASHICGNEKCFNPKHLEWETKASNLCRRLCFSLVEIDGEIWNTNHECRCGETKCRQVKLKAGSEWVGLQE